MARDGNIRQLQARQGCAIGYVVRAIGGQATAANPLRNPQTAQDFRGARGLMVSLHIGRLAAVSRLGNDHLHAAMNQIHAQGQADRPGTHNQDLCLDHWLCPARPKRGYTLCTFW